MIGAKPKVGSVYLLTTDYGDYLLEKDIVLCTESCFGYSKFSLIRRENDDTFNKINIVDEIFRHYDYHCLIELKEKNFFTNKRYKFSEDNIIRFSSLEFNPLYDDFYNLTIIMMKYSGAILSNSIKECDYVIKRVGYNFTEEIYTHTQDDMVKYLSSKERKVYKFLEKKFIILNEDNFLNYYYGDYGDVDVKI